MPIGPELLNPIAGPNPSGSNLRYDPVYDKIKEARREELDGVPQGDWTREIKKADWPLVIKLCSDALTNKSKDLQLAAWQTEALVRREGFAGLRQGLDLCRALIEQFWETLYPEPEDGDLELRAAPLEWIGSRLDDALKKIPLTKGGLNWLSYKISRTVGYEEDAGGSDQKHEAREQAIAEGKTTGEEFDKGILDTPKDFYKQKASDIDACLDTVNELAQACEARFGEFVPSFAGLRESLETIRQAVKASLAKKLEQEPDGSEPSAEVSEEAEAATPVTVTSSGAAAAPALAKARALTSDPADRADAYERVAAVARYLCNEDPANPVPYLLVRALRWGELRAAGSEVDPNLLEPPPTELRQRVKQLAGEGNWVEVIAATEQAMAKPCGRGWLDAQRYFCAACEQQGYNAAAAAVVAELKTLLADYPGLPEMMLLDDTPTANPETQTWLEGLRPSAPESSYVPPPPPEEPEEEVAEAGAERAPDTFAMASEAAARGQVKEGMEMLSREVAQARSGRERFQRKLQMAQICMSCGHDAVAYAILNALASEIDERQLESWESSGMIAHALGLLFRCMAKVKDDPEQKEHLYARICRLDPSQGLELPT